MSTRHPHHRRQRGAPRPTSGPRGLKHMPRGTRAFARMLQVLDLQARRDGYLGVIVVDEQGAEYTLRPGFRLPLDWPGPG